MSKTEMVIDDEIWVRKQPAGKHLIVVADQGNVVVGVRMPDHDGPGIRLTSASVVRRWGTSAGLGELAEKGPIPADVGNGPTVLDSLPCAVVIPSPIMIIECSEQWS